MRPFLMQATPTPNNLAASRVGSNNVLTWDVAMGGFQDFNLQRKIGAGSFSDMTSPSFADRSATDSNSAADGTYTYRIRTRRAKQYGSWSNEKVMVVGAGGESLITETDISWIGSFRGIASGGGFGACYYPTNDSLFFNSEYTDHKVLEQGPIPTLVQSSVMGDLNSIGVIQNRVTINPPDLAGIDNTWNVWSAMPFGGDVYCTVRQFYDANLAATKGHLKIANGTTSLSGTQTGLFKLGTNNPAFYAGYQGLIPSAWQASFGDKPCFCGASGMSIVTRSSFGPTAFAFDPSELGALTATAVDMVHYPFPAHPIANGDSQNLVYNHTSSIVGAIILDDSMLFFGNHGLGPLEYGHGTANPELAGTQAEDGEFFRYDPCISAKGYHAYPYTAQCWAYRMTDLAAAAAGSVEPWESSPYSIWTIDLPIAGCVSLFGVAQIHGTRRFILNQMHPNLASYFGEVVGHVYEVAA